MTNAKDVHNIIENCKFHENSETMGVGKQGNDNIGHAPSQGVGEDVVEPYAQHHAGSFAQLYEPPSAGDLFARDCSSNMMTNNARDNAKMIADIIAAHGQ